MTAFQRASALLLCSAVSLSPLCARAQEKSAQALVQSIVTNELAADANDHSRWMYLDKNNASGENMVKLVVETSGGNVSKTIEIDGHPLTHQQQEANEQKMQRFVTDPALRQKQKHDQEKDDNQAAALTKMLPDAFLWRIVSVQGDDTTLAFRPNPKFNPPTRAARVFAAMQGTMVVNTKQKRIQSLKGTLINNVEFGWFGILGKLYKGGTFYVQRQDVGGGVWEITSTHIHINGHALIFKTISENQDEEKSHFKRAPESITPGQAEKMLNDGTVARELGVQVPE